MPEPHLNHETASTAANAWDPVARWLNFLFRGLGALFTLYVVAATFDYSPDSAPHYLNFVLAVLALSGRLSRYWISPP